MKKWKWIHRWFSLVLGLLLILWAISGIILNHRSLFSNFELNRNLLPPEYRYQNWNNASVRSGLQLNSDSLLIYGNIGIWLTDTTFSQYKPFMEGMPKGVDNIKTSRLIITPHGHLFAGTQTGIYFFQREIQEWIKIALDIHDERITDLTIKNGKLVVLSRSEIFLAGYDTAVPEFIKVLLPAASDDDNQIGLFRTLWVIHSGEIFGLPGKIIIDFFALLLIFFVITGYIYFFFPRWIKKRKKKKLEYNNLIKSSRFSIKWHNKLGIWLGGFLILTTLTGMFLRPPLLIAIGNVRVGKIPFSVLNSHNTWHDRLRTIHWNEEGEYWLIGTNDGIYFTDASLKNAPAPFLNQPPVSVMGINVFEPTGKGSYFVGSFNGLFLWQPTLGLVQDYITGEVPNKKNSAGSPLGTHLISGMIRLENKLLLFEYNHGLLKEKIPMPPAIQSTPMPLWNVALEIHTARIFQNLIGIFYILIIPIFGISTLLILISGIIIWLKKNGGYSPDRLFHLRHYIIVNLFRKKER
ncbi:MAG: peptidase [Bacteroidetes bacterium HGW-Bacteroidetes-1]|jgi:hypothetical protein|nr:MAG: peptidase [Bacteroidetes bacterium HGW-Bacteroidetes-1]